MNKKPDAIVFFDLDGTLFNSHVEILTSSLEAIKKLQQNNMMPIIATGRPSGELSSLMQETKINSVIGMNGQSVIYQGERIFSNDIDTAIIERVHQFSKQETSVPLSFYSDEVMSISENGDPAVACYRYLKRPIPAVDPFLYLSTPIQMLLLLCETGESIYREVFPELTFIRNTPFCVDVFNHGGSKGYGITKLLEIKNFSHVPTYAFGDGMNDFEMFDVVDHPIAMANAVEELKQRAEFITDDNNSDGISNALKKLRLI